MLYMVIEKYKDKEAVYKRFHENGRMMPEGVSYVSSWVTADGNTCYQINEAENEELLHKWASNWNDVTDFEFIPVISSKEMSEKMAVANQSEQALLTGIEPLNALIQKEGILENIRDYYAATNGRLHLLYSNDDFYIAEDTTFQPWLSIMGHLPESMTDEVLNELLTPYVENEKYIAVYTNIDRVSALLQKFEILSYHEDFLIASISKALNVDESGIRLATTDDLPYIEKTYTRSGHEQLLSRINQKQMWVLADDNGIKAYAGIHKDGSLGFEYVDPDSRRQNIGSKMQAFIANQMIDKGMTPYVMISVGNDIAKNLQTKLGAKFANKLFYFYAKGKYELE